MTIFSIVNTINNRERGENFFKMKVCGLDFMKIRYFKKKVALLSKYICKSKQWPKSIFLLFFKTEEEKVKKAESDLKQAEQSFDSFLQVNKNEKCISIMYTFSSGVFPYFVKNEILLTFSFFFFQKMYNSIWLT